MRLLLARHGATANNAQRRYTGQADTPMSAFGERQAAALAERLANEPLDCVVSSDLRRASAMAQRIADQHRLPLRLDADLREISMGAWEGHTFDEIHEREPEQLLLWHEDPVTYAPPGGETIAQVRDRLIHALARWHSAHPDGAVLWVTHGGVIGILLCHLLGMDLSRRWQFRRDNAALSEIAIGPVPEGIDDASRFSRCAVVVRLNDTSHLGGITDAHSAEQFQVL